MTISKSFLSTPNRHIPPIETNNTLMYEELDKANAFNDYFAEQTKLQADASSDPTPPLYQLNSTLSNIHSTHHELELILRSLPLGTAVGPDLVNNRILKELAFELSISHSKLFNYSLFTSIFPSCWKLANVCTVHKKDSQSIVSNYRLISLLSTISKDFERVVFKHVFNHHRDNNILLNTSLVSCHMTLLSVSCLIKVYKRGYVFA